MAPSVRGPAVLIGLLLLAGFSPGQENPVQLNSPAFSLGGPALGQPVAALDVAHNRSGDGIVAYRQQIAPPPTTTYQLWVQPLRRGVPFGPPLAAGTSQDGTTGALELTRIRCHLDDAGNWVVVWDGSDPVSGLLQIWARRYHADTGLLGPVLWVSDSASNGHQILPDVALTPPAPGALPSFHVVWQEGVQAGLSRILLRRYRMVPGGGSVVDLPDPPLQVNAQATPPGGGQERPAIGIDGAGAITVVWQKFASWGTGAPYWRVMLRRRLGSSWLAVLDPSSPGAGVGGLDFSDYAVSASWEPVWPTEARYPPRVAVAPDGRLVVSWRRAVGAPYGLRCFHPGNPTTLVPGPVLAYQPTFLSPGHGLWDAALSNEGSVVFVWENLLTPYALSGRLLLSRLRFDTGATVEDVALDPPLSEAITAVAATAADTGLAAAAWTRGSTGPTMQPWYRVADLNLVELDSSGTPPLLHLAVPAAAGLSYQLWPSVTGGDPSSYALAPLGDGRAADLSVADPLLQWFFTSGGGQPHLLNALGVLGPDGGADVGVVVPPSLAPLAAKWTLLVLDPGFSLPASIRLFTQPETLLIP